MTTCGCFPHYSFNRFSSQQNELIIWIFIFFLKKRGDGVLSEWHIMGGGFKDIIFFLSWLQKSSSCTERDCGWGIV